MGCCLPALRFSSEKYGARCLPAVPESVIFLQASSYEGRREGELLSWAIIARSLSTLAETHHLLPPQQMGARPGRCTVTALDMLLTQLRLGHSRKVTSSVLSMDISGAFDRVHPNRLVHILNSKGIPESIIGWVRSFTSAWSPPTGGYFWGAT